jgi:hypothetical protein
MTKKYPTVSSDYQKAIEKAKRKLRGFIAEKHCAPLMLRIAYDLYLCVSQSLTLGFVVLICTVYDLMVQVALSWDL